MKRSRGIEIRIVDVEMKGPGELKSATNSTLQIIDQTNNTLQISETRSSKEIKLVRFLWQLNSQNRWSVMSVPEEYFFFKRKWTYALGGMVDKLWEMVDKFWVMTNTVSFEGVSLSTLSRSICVRTHTHTPTHSLTHTHTCVFVFNRSGRGHGEESHCRPLRRGH